MLKRLNHYIVPVYDYCMVTEPLTADTARVDRLEEPPGSVGPREPVPLLPTHRRQPDPLGRLRRHLLLGWQGERRTREPSRVVGTTQRRTSSRPSPSWKTCDSATSWGGVIDTSSRFSVFFGRAMGGRVVVRARLHGARRRSVAIRRIGHARPACTAAARSRPRPSSCKSKPLPFPPEPFRFVGIQATRWSLNQRGQDRQAQPLAPWPRPCGPRLRFVEQLMSDSDASRLIRPDSPPPRRVGMSSPASSDHATADALRSDAPDSLGHRWRVDPAARRRNTRLRQTHTAHRHRAAIRTSQVDGQPLRCSRLDCHYGVGSPGFGVWREFVAHSVTTQWVLTRRSDCFPLLYHWRVLDGLPPAPTPDEHFDVDAPR